MSVLLFVVGIVVMVIGLAISIALHEIGHLVPAKLFGVRVGQYMIGMGSTIWSFTRGETEYGIKALPIGGFISMAGMYPATADQRELAGAASERRQRLAATLVQDAQAANAESLDGVDESRTFSSKPVWQRIIIMLGGPFMNLVLATVIFGVLLTGIGQEQATTTVAAVSQCVLPADSEATECADTDQASPALAAGIEPGDVLVSLDGTVVSDFAEASKIIQANAEKTIPVVVERDGEQLTLTLTPMANTVTTDGVTTTTGFAGITAQVVREHQPITTAFTTTGENVDAVIDVVIHLPERVWNTAHDLFTGADRSADGPMSIIGVGRLAGDVAAADAPVLDRIAVILSLLASLNVSLFVFNLVPLLPLDGGHIVIALWDGLKRLFAKITGRPRPAPADATKLVPVTLVVVVLFIGMSAILFAADLFNPVKLIGG
ncbi:MAG: M50 family metallopeptidase [Microbacterium sp.]